ncbi:Uncharacterized protein TCAP_06556 [Tolypocladium capitatum]|uniref:Uncharacterized protein n=1 Tax=Tolypocladium capitatum TaxID=45235 RepID=A0A2K3Q7Q5_9HYPO|nr:Uncharacterized protein TCAP_06556 [Tolypocladium capitatum]
MMATEPSIEKPADVSASPEPRPADQAHHAALDPPSVNGNAATAFDDISNKRITSVEEQLNSADVSVSGGSDTEASRTDWARQKDGDKGHGRTASSAKKPATFKAVSVNKTFLASKASVSSAVPKASDRPATGPSTPPPGATTLSASRPRLVAKAGAGTRDSAPRFSFVVNGGNQASAPDPSVVWNKNRPPEPKKFTDEELKKYGIHMASRLNEDDAQGQNKWADIDDDDDDWAPEAITWGDGTKTTLPHSDEQVVVMSDNGSVTSKGKGQEKPTSPAPLGSAGSPLPKPGNLASGKGLILKGASQDKPALVAKPPVPPAAAKSPWASLPPVDRASPASAEAVNFTRGHPKELSSFKGASMQPKEIAADDFSRSSWRDGPSHGGRDRELYNSHSGRYEPAPDRRGSMRSDTQAKHPALLQRPQPSDQPAEPSSAFQTTRASHDPPFGRRRGSSNASGGSGSYLQRISKGNDGSIQPPHELLGARRTSLAGSVESPVSTGNVPVSGQTQPRHQPCGGWMPRSSPGGTFATTHNGPVPSEAKAGPPAPIEPMVDEVEYQKKLMRERVELAKKRRQDEEAREEAAKKERIQKKLESLGPPPDKKSDKKDVPLKEETPKPTHIQQREPVEPAGAPTQVAGQDHQTGADTATSSLRDPPGASSKAVSPKGGPPPGPASRRPSHGQEGKRADPWAGPGPRPDRFPSWAAGVPPTSRNVWGSPDNDRGLGNGTFNPDLGRIPGTAVAAPQGHKGPSPIAPPTTTRAPPQGQPQPQPQPPIGSHTSRYGGAPGPDIASKWVAAVADNDKKISAARLAERAGRERQLSEHGLTIEDAQPTIKDTWRPVHLPGDGTRRAVGAVEVQSHQSGPWTAAQEKLGQGTAPVEGPTPPANAGVIGSGNSSILSQTGSGAPSKSRASRFFPTKDSRYEMGSAAEPSRPASPSPPPPTMEGHPAYEGDVMRPHVSLPKPQPVVKLPPAMLASQPSQPRANMAWPSRITSKDAPRGPSNQGHVSHREGEGHRGTWQDKINTLLKPSPPKHMGVDPASRSMLDQAIHQNSATVSLPIVAASTNMPGRHKTPISKPMAEECFEEQEMGSLPQIRLPHRAPEAAWQPAEAQTKPLPKRFLVQAYIVEPYYFAADVVGSGNALKILFPGMAEAKIVTIPFSATRGGRGGHGRPSARHRGPSHGPGPRGGKREAPNTYGGADPGPSNSGRGSRGAYRSRGSESWNRQPHPQPQSSAQQKTQPSLTA